MSKKLKNTPKIYVENWSAGCLYKRHLEVHFDKNFPPKYYYMIGFEIDKINNTGSMSFSADTEQERIEWEYRKFQNPQLIPIVFGMILQSIKSNPNIDIHKLFDFIKMSSQLKELDQFFLEKK